MSDFLPQEIIQYILEFNPEHRDLFSKVLDSLLLFKNRQLFDKITSVWLSQRQHLPYAVYLREALSDDYARIFNVLSKCDCCRRHQLRRPKVISPIVQSLIEPDAVFFDENQVVYGSGRTCNCSCRKTCKWICEAFANSKAATEEIE